MQSRIINPKELLKSNPVLQHIDLSLCVDCKAVKRLCGMARCPLIDALDVYPDTDAYEKVNTPEVFGPSTQVFVGSHGYPRLNTGPLTSLLQDPKLVRKSSNPAEWVDLGLKDIISLRYGLVRGKKSLYIKPERRNPDKLYDQMGQLTMSVNPVDVESIYSTLPRLTKSFDIETQPMGPTGTLAKMDIASNPKIPKKVDYVLEDELLSTQQINNLYQEDYDVYYLQNILSAGLTGLNANKKLVPTRWSITATDDMIGKEMIPKLRDFPWIKQIEIWRGELLGNEYTIIMVPGNWTFENFETWISGGIFTLGTEEWKLSYCKEGFTSKEYYKGRSSYASQAGGYYATRLAVLEHLMERRKQAKVTVLREITPNYVVPVGVWQVREGMRQAMQNKVASLSTKKEIKEFLSGKLHVPISKYLNTAVSFTQSSLDDFF